jgi:hypothetical protein
MRLANSLLIAFTFSLGLGAQAPSPTEAGRTLDAPGTVPERVGRLVAHLNRVMPFVATDYRTRTVEEILQRGAGNCADHARVLRSLLESRGIQVRWVQEINLQAPSERRQANAAAMVQQRGAQASVFGRSHNDHRWLEVWDPQTEAWFPADSSIGVSGAEAWIRQRLGFAERPAAVADMIAPVFVEALAADKARVPRSSAYLIEGFNRTYGGRLAGLPAWPAWVAAVKALEPLASGAFRSEVDLHGQGRRFEDLAKAYARLAAEARGQILVPGS